MPGVVRFTDPKANVEGDLLGDLVLDAQNKLINVIPLSGTTNGQWIQTKSYDKMCLSLWCDTAATFEVCGSMLVAQPLNSYNGYQLFVTKTYAAPTEEILAIKTPLRWLKVKVTANTGNVLSPFIGV